MRNALTIDVEDYFHVEAFSRVIPRESWGALDYRCERNVARILQLFAEYGVKATFFILGWVAERSPQIVRDICAAGHEVACHGMSHRLIYRQSPDEFRQETERSKSLLEDISGVPVIGYRAASFSIVKDSLWALDTLIDLGFTYDSSIFPIRHDNYGMPDSPLGPHLRLAPSGRSIIEFPMAVSEWMGLRLPVSGGGYFRIFPYPFVRHMLTRINDKSRRPFTFYLHPWEIDPDQPRIAAGLKSRLRHYTNLGRCEQRLANLLGQFSFGTMREVLTEQRLLA